jgi:hypothetical protein
LEFGVEPQEAQLEIFSGVGFVSRGGVQLRKAREQPEQLRVVLLEEGEIDVAVVGLIRLEGEKRLEQREIECQAA